MGQVKWRRCRECGEKKSKRYFTTNRADCNDCRNERRRAERAAEPRKVCPGCEIEKRIGLYYHWTEKGHPRVSRLCKVCDRARIRARRQQVMADPYLARIERRRKAEWAKRNVNSAENSRRYRARVKRERPDVYQQQLEDARVRNHLRSERLGMAPAVKRAPVKQTRGPVLPVEPLLVFLKGFEFEGSEQRALYRATHETKTVTIDVADRLIVAAGGLTSLVYPELYA